MQFFTWTTINNGQLLEKFAGRILDIQFKTF